MGCLNVFSIVSGCSTMSNSYQLVEEAYVALQCRAYGHTVKLDIFTRNVFMQN